MKKTILKVLVVIAICLGLGIYFLSQTTYVVTVDHTFNAPIEKVWTLWNDAESIKKWWSPKGYTAPVIKNDFRENGNFLFSMQAPDGEIHWNVGRYTQIIPQQKIVSTMSFADKDGNVIPASQAGVPGKWPTEVTVTVDFKDANGKTHVTVTEVGIPAIMYVFAKMGWQQQFDKFDELIK